MTGTGNHRGYTGGAVNWIGLRTLYLKEFQRFAKLPANPYAPLMTCELASTHPRGFPRGLRDGETVTPAWKESFRVQECSGGRDLGSSESGGARLSEENRAP